MLVASIILANCWLVAKDRRSGGGQYFLEKQNNEGSETGFTQPRTVCGNQRGADQRVFQIP